jgi:RNA polymerase sigma factor (sigma-70 family)
LNGRVESEPPIQELLQRWHAGDERALAAIVERELPWLRQRVAQRLGEFLGAKAEVGDYLHDALLEFLRDAPRFQVRDEAQLRALLARVIENTLRDKNEWFRAKRRALRPTLGLPDDSVLDLHSGVVQSSTPSRGAERDERRAWVCLALELLEPEDRRLILARDYEGRSFAEIGTELGASPDAVRMRWNRAVGRLGQALVKLRSGAV